MFEFALKEVIEICKSKWPNYINEITKIEYRDLSDEANWAEHDLVEKCKPESFLEMKNLLSLAFELGRKFQNEIYTETLNKILDKHFSYCDQELQNDIVYLLQYFKDYK